MKRSKLQVRVRNWKLMRRRRAVTRDQMKEVSIKTFRSSNPTLRERTIEEIIITAEEEDLIITIEVAIISSREDLLESFKRIPMNA